MWWVIGGILIAIYLGIGIWIFKPKEWGWFRKTLGVIFWLPALIVIMIYFHVFKGSPI